MERTNQHNNSGEPTTEGQPGISRGMWAVLATLGSLLIGVVAGVISGTAGHASFMAATGVAAGGFVTSMTLAILILTFVHEGDGR